LDQRWSPAKFNEKAKEWVKDFVDVYQIKDVIPYMQCHICHIYMSGRIRETKQSYNNILSTYI